MKRYLIAIVVAAALPVLAGNPPVPYVMSSGDYSESFGDIANWTANFAGGIGAAPWGSVAVNATGTIPSGTRVAVSTATAPAANNTTTGVQKGGGALQFLTTGTGDNTNSIAVDLLLDFTGRNAGALSFDWAMVTNSTGTREASLRLYASTDGTTFTELTGAFISVTNNIASTGTASSVPLPVAFNNSSTARIRFYEYNGGVPDGTGNRPKIAIDNIAITSTGDSAPIVLTPPASQTNYIGATATFTVGALDAESYQWFSGTTAYTNGGNISGATSSALSLANLMVTDAASNITVVLSNGFGFTTSTPPASLTVVPAPQAAFKFLQYNVDGNSVAGGDPTNWATTAPQVQAIGRELVYLNPDIISFNEIPTAYKFQMTNWVNAFLPGYYLATNAAGDGSIQNFVVSRFPIIGAASHLHSADLAPFGYTNSDFSRDLFEAQISVPGLGQPLHVFVAHLKATVETPQDDANKRAAEAAAISNYFVNVFLPGTNGSDLYLLSGDMNEDIFHPETNDYISGHPIQILTNGTGLVLNMPTNHITGSELTESIRGPLNVRFDYIFPCGPLYSNIISSEVFRTDLLSPTPAGLSNNDDMTASDHLPVVMIFQNPFAATPPSIIAQPVSLTNNGGTTAAFSVAVSGALPLSYQWTKGGNVLTNGGNYSGATSGLLIITNVSQLDEADYSVTISNAYGVDTSSNATLTVITPAETLALWDFNSTPPDASIATGTNVPASGSGTAAPVGTTAIYTTGAPADPATSDDSAWDIATFPTQGTGNKSRGVQFNVSTMGHRNVFISYYEYHSNTSSRYMRFQYSTNGTTFIDSDVETFTTPTTFLLQQHDLTGLPGVDNNPNFAFRIVAEFESTAIGTTNTNYVATASASSYGTAGTLHFDLMQISGEPLFAPGVTAPSDVVTQAGSTAFFAVTATGSTPFGYQWQKDGASLTNGARISGATSATLALSGVVPADAGGYAVVVTNVVGAVTSSVANLTVTCPAITLGALPGGTNNTAYSQSIGASGGIGPYTYALGSGTPPAGLTLATNGTLSGKPTVVGTNSFTVVATDSDGCAGTNNYTLGIVPFACPTITLSSLPAAPKGGKYSQMVAANGGIGLYTYSHFGAVPPGLTFTDSTAVLAGKPTTYGSYSFTLTATDTNGCTGSRVYTLLVSSTGLDTTGPKVTITTPKNGAVVTNPPVTLTGKATDAVQTTNVTYTLDGGPVTEALFTVTNAAPWSISLSNLTAGAHTVTVQGTDLSGNLGAAVSVSFNYGTNSFLPLAGVYYGLFSESSSNVAYPSAGFAKVTITAKPSKLPTFSASFNVAGTKVSGSGTFGMDGTGLLKKPMTQNGQNVTLSLTLPFDGSGTLTGTISNAAATPPWSSTLLADLAVTNKVATAGTNYDGTYTLVVPSPTNTIGDGYGFLIITNGQIKLGGGKLANAQAFSQSGAYLSEHGDWPLFVKGDTSGGINKSELLGWASVSTNHAITTANLVWINTGGLVTYPGGFTNNVGLAASLYDANFGSGLVLSLDSNTPVANGSVTLSGNGLTTNIVNSVSLQNVGGKNKFLDTLGTKTNKQYSLVVTLSAPKGTIGGNFKAPDDGVAKGNIFGVVLQSSNTANGYFLQNPVTPQSGTFRLK